MNLKNEGKFSYNQLTQYALFLHMKDNIIDFETIFNGQSIISEIMFRYELDGSFKNSVLKLMPLLNLNDIDSELKLNSFLKLITDNLIKEKFLRVREPNSLCYYIKIS